MTASPARIATWLRRGARDIVRTPAASLAHGVVFTVVAAAILAVGWRHAWLLAGAFSGFVLPAPALATGLYDLSRRIERGESPTLEHAVLAWRNASPELWRLGALLAAIGTVWVGFCWLVLRASDAGTHAATGGGVEALLGRFVGTGDPGLLLAWMFAGGLLAAIVFSISVVSVPMLLEHRVSLRAAVAQSVRIVAENPLTMAAWAAVIMLATLAAAFTGVGWVIVVPLLGHASWHAYRDVAGDLHSRHAAAPAAR